MIGLYTGRLGAGKTLAAVRDLWDWSLQAGGAPVASNHTLNPDAFAPHRAKNPHFKIHKITDTEDIIRFVVEGGGILELDEMHQDADARMSMQMTNVLLSQFLMFLRKVGITALSTAQDVGQLDKRLRAVTDFQVHCEGFGQRENRTHVLTCVHFRTQQILKREVLQPDEAKRWHGAYNTFEFTRKLRFPGTFAAFEQFMLRLEEAAKFAREYTGAPSRAWEAFGIQSEHPKSKAPSRRPKVSPRSDAV